MTSFTRRTTRVIAPIVMLLVFSAVAIPAHANWESAGSGTATARSDAIATPTGLSGTCNLVLGRSVTLTWSSSKSWASYEVRWGTTSGGPYPTSVLTSDTTYSTPSLSGSALGTTYYFVVRAVKGPWLSANSNQVSRTIGTLTCV